MTGGEESIWSSSVFADIKMDGFAMLIVLVADRLTAPFLVPLYGAKICHFDDDRMEWTGESWREWIRRSREGKASTTSVACTQTGRRTKRQLIYCSCKSTSRFPTSWGTASRIHSKWRSSWRVLYIPSGRPTVECYSIGNGETEKKGEGCSQPHNRKCYFSSSVTSFLYQNSLARVPLWRNTELGNWSGRLLLENPTDPAVR